MQTVVNYQIKTTGEDFDKTVDAAVISLVDVVDFNSFVLKQYAVINIGPLELRTRAVISKCS